MPIGSRSWAQAREQNSKRQCSTRMLKLHLFDSMIPDIIAVQMRGRQQIEFAKILYSLCGSFPLPSGKGPNCEVEEFQGGMGPLLEATHALIPVVKTFLPWQSPINTGWWTKQITVKMT